VLAKMIGGVEVSTLAKIAVTVADGERTSCIIVRPRSGGVYSGCVFELFELLDAEPSDGALLDVTMDMAAGKVKLDLGVAIQTVFHDPPHRSHLVERIFAFVCSKSFATSRSAAGDGVRALLDLSVHIAAFCKSIPPFARKKYANKLVVDARELVMNTGREALPHLTDASAALVLSVGFGFDEEELAELDAERYQAAATVVQSTVRRRRSSNQRLLLQVQKQAQAAEVAAAAAAATASGAQADVVLLREEVRHRPRCGTRAARTRRPRRPHAPFARRTLLLLAP
jgi:hypothetical protein